MAGIALGFAPTEEERESTISSVIERPLRDAGAGAGEASFILYSAGVGDCTLRLASAVSRSIGREIPCVSFDERFGYGRSTSGLLHAVLAGELLSLSPDDRARHLPGSAGTASHALLVAGGVGGGVVAAAMGETK